MEIIRIFDTTLRDGEQSPGAAMNPQQKLEIAKALDRLGVDVIEAGFPISSNTQFDAVQLIAKHICRPYIAGLARCVKQDIDAVYQSLKDYDKKMLHTFIATSPIHMQYKLNKKPTEILTTIKETLLYAKKFFKIIEFSAEDASRSEYPFLIEVIKLAVTNGATTFNIQIPLVIHCLLNSVN